MPACAYCHDRGFLRVRRLGAPAFRHAVRRCVCNGGAPVDPATWIGARATEMREHVEPPAGALRAVGE